MPGENKELLIETIKERSCLKRNVYENTIVQFESLKKALKDFSNELDEKVHSFDKRLEIKYEEVNNFECRLTMAGDTLIFYMHSNVFQFDQEHHIWNTSYVKEDESRSYCGIIHIYNFLADSFRLNRMNDIGYMIGRVFVNKEDHYLVEGRRQLGYLFNDFVNSHLDKATWKRILESALLYSLDFDLLVPPYNQVNTTSVMEINQIGKTHGLKTGKRFGFQFSADQSDEIR
jgi:hypothetical protein